MKDIYSKWALWISVIALIFTGAGLWYLQQANDIAHQENDIAKQQTMIEEAYSLLSMKEGILMRQLTNCVNDTEVQNNVIILTMSRQLITSGSYDEASNKLMSFNDCACNDCVNPVYSPKHSFDGIYIYIFTLLLMSILFFLIASARERRKHAKHRNAVQNK